MICIPHRGTDVEVEKEGSSRNPILVLEDVSSKRKYVSYLLYCLCITCHILSCTCHKKCGIVFHVIHCLLMCLDSPYICAHSTFQSKGIHVLHLLREVLPFSSHLELEWNQDGTVGKLWLVIIVVHMNIVPKSGKCVAGAGAVKCVESSRHLIVRLMAWDGYQTVRSFATWYPPTVSFPTESYVCLRPVREQCQLFESRTQTPL